MPAAAAAARPTLTSTELRYVMSNPECFGLKEFVWYALDAPQWWAETHKEHSLASRLGVGVDELGAAAAQLTETTWAIVASHVAYPASSSAVHATHLRHTDRGWRSASPRTPRSSICRRVRRSTCTALRTARPRPSHSATSSRAQTGSPASRAEPSYSGAPVSNSPAPLSASVCLRHRVYTSACIRHRVYVIVCTSPCIYGQLASDI